MSADHHSFDDHPDDDAPPDWDGTAEDETDIPEFSTGEHDVEISMEVDADGREVWYAADSQLPGDSSTGHSLEEAMEGVEERRRQYREVLRRSREARAPDPDTDPPEA